ncbi:helix-turn-helix domain-containing protein [Streptomyces sp. NPDC088097]|uniref:helix-turn-helix domain-containing protein n=1 Tax=Streptomyces sp. NPDC088097 TaxID=3365823 RepID=UPI0038309CEC
MTQDVETTTSDADLGLPSPKERRRLREAGRLTHEEVASAMGVTATTVRSWETGRTEPRGRKREAYAGLLARLTDPDASPRADQSPDRERSQEPTPDPTPDPKPEQDQGTEPAAAAEPAAAKTAEHRAPTAAHDPPRPEPSGETATTPRAPGGTRNHAAAPPTRTGGPGTRPKAAVKRAAKPPVSMVRHEAKSPVRTGAPAPAPLDPPPGASTTTPIPPTPTTQAPEPGTEPAPPAAQSPATAPDTTPGLTTGAAPEPTTAPDTSPDTAAATATETAPEPDPARPPLGPAEAFDALHAYAAPALLRQAYLLTGRRALAQESVERAFQQAWGQWPEVAADPDPVGWVRAAAYEYALSPWHRFRRAHRRPDKPPVEAADRILLDAVLALPPVHRRTVLLYDGVGLDLPDTAAETEASTPTAGNRLLNAHADLADRIPELAAVEPDKVSAVLRERLGSLRPSVTLETRPAPRVRALGEYRAGRWTKGALGLTVVIAVATGYTLATAPVRYEPPRAPGTSVSGVPPHSGPQQLTDRSRALQDKLRSDPASGPARLAPRLD